MRTVVEATDDGILEVGVRLLKVWPQDRRGDKSGLGDELRIMLQERRPGRRALGEACRTLNLTEIYLPSVAEMMDATAEADKGLQTRATACARLSDRIARAEAAPLPKPSRGVAQPRPKSKPDPVAAS